MTVPQDNILRHFSRCPLCNAEYSGARVSVVEQRADRTVFHVTCPSCETSMMLVMTQGQMGMVCVGSITDVMAHELSRLTRTRIHPNAILDFYTQIQRHKGSLAEVVQKRQRHRTKDRQ